VNGVCGKGGADRVLVGHLMERNNLEDLGVDGKIKSK